MDEIHVKLILDRFQAQDSLIKTVETGIHRRLDTVDGRLKDLESAPKRPSGWRNLTVGGILVGALEAGKAAYGWFKG